MFRPFSFSVTYCSWCYYIYMTWVSHRSRKSSATHSYQCVQYFRVSKQWCVCQCLGFLTCAHYYVDACDCTGTGLYGHRKRVCTEGCLWEEKSPLPHRHRGLEPASVLRLAFQSNALATELFPPEADMGKVIRFTSFLSEMLAPGVTRQN